MDFDITWASTLPELQKLTIGKTISPLKTNSSIESFDSKAKKLLEKNAFVRLHFAISAKNWLPISINSSNSKKIVEYFFDTKEYFLLRHNCFLLRRTYENKEIEWKLKFSVSLNSDFELEFYEIKGEENVLQALQIIFGQKDFKNPIFYAPVEMFAFDVTRIILNENLWVDISSWFCQGKAGLYAVGTSRISSTREYDLKQIKKLLSDDSIFCVPSRTLAIMFSTLPPLFKLLDEKSQLVASEQFKYYPPITEKESNPFHSLHPLLTSEEFEKIFDEPEDEE